MIKNMIILYLINLYYALLNKPIMTHSVQVIEKEHVVTQPFNAQQIRHLEKMFPLPVWEEGKSITELAYHTGMHHVVAFIKAWSAKGGRVV